MSTLSGAAAKKMEGAALIDYLKKRIGTAAIAGALVPLAVAGMTTTADAGIPSFDRSSRVDSSVTDPGGGGNPSQTQFLYDFTLVNTSLEAASGGTRNVEIVNWELPLFSLQGIDLLSITSPESWTFEIIDIEGNIAVTAGSGTQGDRSDVYNAFEGPYGEYIWNYDPAEDPALIADPNVYGGTEGIFIEENFANKLILHWYSEDSGISDPDNPVLPALIANGGDNTLSGFSFQALAGGTNVPYLASWNDELPTAGDPPSPGGSSFAVPNNASVPEPGPLALMATGLLALLGIRRRRKKVEACALSSNL